MKSNAGSVDRGIRIVLGAALLSLAVSGQWWGWIGVIPLLTGLLGWCPLYTILGISSCRTNRAEEKTLS